MKKKKKLSKKQKEIRRVSEANKAAVKNFAQFSSSSNSTVSTAAEVSQTQQSMKGVGYELPIAQIKTDLIGNLIFMALSMGVLVALSITNFGYEQLRPFLKF